MRAALTGSVLGLLSLAGFFGCEPALQSGVYGCDNGSCPEGFFCHDADKLCYDTPEVIGSEGGAPGTGGGDGDGTGGDDGTGGGDGDGDGDGPEFSDIGDDCSVDGDCESGACARNPDPDGPGSDKCSIPCDADSDCSEETFGTEGYCLPGGKCIQKCEQQSDCTLPETCWEFGHTDGPGHYACYWPDATDEGAEPECGPKKGGCPAPLVCIVASADPGDGVCGQNCDTGGDCPDGSNCLELFEGDKRCLKACASTDDDCATGNDCVELSGTGDYCGPGAWDGLQLPLSRHMGPGGMMP